MKIQSYKSKSKTIAGEYTGQFDFLETQVQIISDSKKERDLVMKKLKDALKNGIKS